MSDAAFSKIPPSFLNTIASGGAILFLGAGFSLGNIVSSKDRDRRGLKNAIVSEFQPLLQDPSFDVANLSMEEVIYYLELKKGISRRTIVEALCRFLATSKELQQLEAFLLLRELITLAPRLFETIITTNWDRGIEEALRGLERVRPEPFVLDDDLVDYDPAQLSVLKIHGDISQPDTIVLGSLDYDLYERSHPRIVERLRILFSTKFVVLIGYSGKDENFRRLYRGLYADLAGRSRGGCIVAPALDNRDHLWAPSVKLLHVECTAQDFLKAVLEKIATTTYGASPRLSAVRRRTKVRLSEDPAMAALANELRRAFALRNVWVARLRPEQRPNLAIGAVAAIYVAERCGATARSMALSVGETIEGFVETLEPSAFARPLLVVPTVVLLAGPRSFNDPSHLAQRLVARFSAGRAEGVPLRLPDEPLLSMLLPSLTANERKRLYAGIRRIAEGLLHRAMEADVIVGSARPPHWFGGGGPPPGRTIPIQYVQGSDASRVSAKLVKSRVAAVHHMITLSDSGEDLSMQIASGESRSIDESVCRPSLDQLRNASTTRQTVIVAAASAEKLSALAAVLSAGLCNTLVVDESLAEALLKHSNRSS
jgi:hypothetical protein